MKVTIVEVAKAANVSVATVSRVINGNYPVKEETKQKVLKIIQELEYTPNIQARDLIKQQSSTVGVVVPSINNMFFPSVVDGIEKYFDSTQYSLFLCTTNHDKDKEIARINELIARNVAGIIVIDPNLENCKSKFYDNISKSTPVVFVNGYNTSSNISSVSNDETSGARMVIEYLFENSHRDILFIRGEKSYSYDVKEKVYRDVMSEINNLHEEYIINIGYGNSIETVNKTTEECVKILDSNKKISAVFACNDLMGIGIINACKKLNKKIPEDLSVIGYDNIELSEIVEPHLTTVDQNMFLLGENAATLLIEKIENGNKYSKKIILNNELIIRNT
ncbi:LacI family transcriptional regulator [Romboutsia weinsteinii]|uniref:LacI family transcriptional regulator n=1 Tax=Romboutsia weinsteinii TaxID=2020949 RepID=A0A371IXC9_9FIRM|nr:LacI family DNA-binding transcriptional regulator [Romboutsia weinsteinii]RDY25136.1 LacI family transcriptional regulator [Romboutsia weinsteinii]